MLGKNAVTEFDLNKFPINDDEDDEEKEFKEVMKNLLRIYIHRFY